LHHFLHITTFIVYVTACDLQKPCSFDKTAEITSYIQYWLKITNSNLPYLYSAPLLHVAFKFHHNLWHQKTRVPGIFWSTVCMMKSVAFWYNTGL